MANVSNMITAGRWTYSPQEFDRMCDEARRRGEAELRSKPQAISVRYDQRSRHVIIGLNNGCTMTIPSRLLQGLRDAAARDLKQVEIMGLGLAIEWPTLDMQFTISGLLAGVFGTKSWMEELHRRTRKARSPAKARAARRNGRKQIRRKTISMGQPAANLNKALDLAARLEDEEIMEKIARRK